MGIKFDSDKINEDLRKMYPEPFPEIWEKWQAPTDEFLQGIKTDVKAVYNEDEEAGLTNLIEANEAKIKRLKRRLDKDLSHDDDFKIQCAIEYFEISIRYANELLNEITELSKDGRVKYTTPMKEEAEKYYREHKKEADKIASKTWIEKKLIPHLAKEFDKDNKFFNESTIRKDWLNLTA